jgi:hypothetical protein
MLFVVPVVLLFKVSNELPVGKPELVDVSNAVDEIIVVLAHFLLVALEFALLAGVPLVPHEPQEVLLDVLAGVEYDQARLAPLVWPA